MKRLHYYYKLKKEEHKEKQSPLEKIKPKKTEKKQVNRFL